MAMHMREQQVSPLSRSVHYFANIAAGILVLLILPQIARHVRPDILGYFTSEFSQGLAEAGSWVFVVLLGAGLYFGLSALIQVTLHILLSMSVRKGGF